MSYQDIGYNQFLTREENISAQVQQLDPLQFEQFAPEMSGTKIIGGRFQSIDKNYLIDLENNINKVTAGEIERILYGKLPDGTYGLIINDEDGNEIGRLNENGLTIQKGKISIKGDNDLEFINSRGIISPNTFQLLKLYRELSGNITATSFVNINGTNLNFSIQQQTIVLFNLSCRINITAAEVLALQLVIDEIREGPYLQTTDAASGSTSYHLHYTKLMNSGRHSVRIQALVSAGTGNVNDIFLSTLIFGL